MSYETTITLKIDAKNQRITGKFRSNNSYDKYNRKIVEPYQFQAKDIDDFKNQIFALANNVLGGSIKMNNNITFKNRLLMLQQHHFLISEDINNDWWQLPIKNQNDHVYNILIGKTKLPLAYWTIENDTHGISINRDTASVINKALIKTNPRSYSITKFYNRDQLNKIIDVYDLTTWMTGFNLKINKKTT